MLSSKPSVSRRSVRAAKSLRVSTKQSRSRLSIKAQAGKNRDVSAKAAETAVSPPAKEEKSLWDTIKEGITMHYKKSESMYGPGSDRRKKRLPARMRIDGQWCVAWDMSPHPSHLPEHNLKHNAPTKE